MRNLRLAAICAAALALSCGLGRPAQAQVIFTDNGPLSTLITSQAQIIVGDKVFKNFGAFVHSAGGGAQLVDASSIDVSTNWNPGTQQASITFTCPQWLILDGQSQDSGWAYDVATINGQPHITKAAMDLDAYSANIAAGGLVNISDTLTPGGGISVDSFPGDQHAEHSYAPAVSAIHVVKDLGLTDISPNTTGTGVIASVSHFSQTYTQDTTVPEPGALALVLPGLLPLGCAFLRRRKRG